MLRFPFRLFRTDPGGTEKEKGLDLLLNNFDITKIGGKEANETALEVFREDYKKGQTVPIIQIRNRSLGERKNRKFSRHRAAAL